MGIRTQTGNASREVRAFTSGSSQPNPSWIPRSTFPRAVHSGRRRTHAPTQCSILTPFLMLGDSMRALCTPLPRYPRSRTCQHQLSWRLSTTRKYNDSKRSRHSFTPTARPQTRFSSGFACGRREMMCLSPLRRDIDLWVECFPSGGRRYLRSAITSQTGKRNIR